MARTTAEAVEGIIEVDSAIDLTPFITVANFMVTKHCVDTNFTAAGLEIIERYLAAWLYAIRDRRAVREEAGDVAETKQHVEFEL
jgi:hypothetical protein